MSIVCFDDPKAILENKFCLSALSKNLRGETGLEKSSGLNCAKPKCSTLRTLNVIKLAVTTDTPCDSPLAKDFNGTLIAKQFATAFDTDGAHRGFHAGDFELLGQNGLRVDGRMSGMTNEGTHREPLKSCQRCSDVGIMEGRLCGSVTASNNPELKGCQVMAAYRIKFDPTAKGMQGSMLGTLEGVIISPCLG